MSEYNIPLFDVILILYPIVMLVVLKILEKGFRIKANTHKGDINSLEMIKITAGHTILMLVVIFSFILVNRIACSWYVAFGIFGSMLAEKINLVNRYLSLFEVVTIIVMLVSWFSYKKGSLEHFSVTIHSLGLMSTLVCYRNILNTQEKLITHADEIIKCEGAYIEGLIIASIFLIHCSRLREREKSINYNSNKNGSNNL